jgi:hypothetical protein
MYWKIANLFFIGKAMLRHLVYYAIIERRAGMRRVHLPKGPAVCIAMGRVSYSQMRGAACLELGTACSYAANLARLI